MIGWNAFSLFRSLRSFLSLFQFGPCEKVLPPIFREPARSQRRFVVHMSDIGADEFLPQMMAEVGRSAPGVRLR